MKFIVTIQDTKTGETRLYSDPCDYESLDHFLYTWTDGNFGCDCNRGLLFARVNDEPDPECRCGFELFRCPSALREDGETIEIDDPEDQEVPEKN